MVKWFALGLILAVQSGMLAAPSTDKDAAAEHSMIDVGKETASSHTTHPDAQWYPEAGLGLFIHWGIASTRAMNISWPMIPGRPLAAKRIDDPAERERIIREHDWNLNSKPNSITPNAYWEMAKDFHPDKYDPDKWLAAAHEAGFKYAVLTTRHHEGFSLWPSKFDDFNTSTYVGGKDLVKDYVEACRRNGMKVGLYYSPPDWHFDREYMSFLYGGATKKNPEMPSLDEDLNPRTSKHTPEEIKEHQKAYAAMVRGQITELLTNYGKIDLIWFDGKPAVPNATEVITIEEIRKLQPGIVINPRLHGHGDFVTYERKLGTDKPVTEWAEFCNTWTGAWPDTPEPFRANGFVLGQYVTCRSLGVNYLLGVGPMASGEFRPAIYENMKVVGEWMKANGESVRGTKPLPATESANVPATASGAKRFLFALPKFERGGMYEKDIAAATDETLTLKAAGKACQRGEVAGGW